MMYMKYTDMMTGEVLSRGQVSKKVWGKAEFDCENITANFQEFLLSEKTSEEIYYIYRGCSADNLKKEYASYLWKHLDKIGVEVCYSILKETFDLLEEAFNLCPEEYDVSNLLSAAKENNVEFLKGWIESVEE
jgi:hypothetical protein